MTYFVSYLDKEDDLCHVEAFDKKDAELQVRREYWMLTKQLKFMKRVEIKETVSKYVWEAIDGTKFNSEEECKKYDNSAEAVLLANYNSLVINSFDEE